MSAALWVDNFVNVRCPQGELPELVAALTAAIERGTRVDHAHCLVALSGLADLPPPGGAQAWEIAEVDRLARVELFLGALPASTMEFPVVWAAQHEVSALRLSAISVALRMPTRQSFAMVCHMLNDPDEAVAGSARVSLWGYLRKRDFQWDWSAVQMVHEAPWTDRQVQELVVRVLTLPEPDAGPLPAPDGAGSAYERLVQIAPFLPRDW